MKRKPSKAGRAPKTVKQARIEAETAEATATAAKKAVHAAESKLKVAKKALKSVERTAKKARKHARRAKKVLLDSIARQLAVKKRSTASRKGKATKAHKAKPTPRKAAPKAAAVDERGAVGLPTPMPPMELPPV